MWGGLTSLTLPDWNASPFMYRLGAAFAFPLACAAGAFSLLAICLRVMRTRYRLLDSLSAHAYSIYLMHYIFVVWLQFSLLHAGLNAIGKAGIVFVGGLALSWAASAGFAMLAARHSNQVGKGAIVDQPR
jgi:glucans biosynthesis protein C